MRQPAEHTLPEALAAFDFGGQVAGALRYGQGHINDTFCVYVQTPQGDARRFILQRINTGTFRDPKGLMENIVGVTDYLRDVIAQNGGDPAREAMTVLRTRTGGTFFAGSEGGAWRAYPFIEGTVCLQSVQAPAQFYESARAFGRFQQLLAGYPAATLHETIEKFHDTRQRFANFETALAADACGRAKEVQAEVEFAMARKADCAYLMDLLEQGKLPLRVTHNDTKLNNVLLDKATGRGICVIDLDTVMPGLCAYDFGDAIRYGASTAAEDERDLSRVNLSLSLYRAYAEGYLSEVGNVLTGEELRSLPVGAKMMTLETGVRFLTDYLDGDVYFKVACPDHNLVRARTQLKLLQDMDAHWDEMVSVIGELGSRKKGGA